MSCFKAVTSNYVICVLFQSVNPVLSSDESSCRGEFTKVLINTKVQQYQSAFFFLLSSLKDLLMNKDLVISQSMEHEKCECEVKVDLISTQVSP